MLLCAENVMLGDMMLRNVVFVFRYGCCMSFYEMTLLCYVVCLMLSKLMRLEVMICYDMPFYAMPCHAMLCHAMPFDVSLCYYVAL